MIDPTANMMGAPQMPTAGASQGMPPAGGLPGQFGGSAVEKNLSIFNPKDFILMVKTMANDPKATVRDLLQRLGIDADGPVTQVTDFLMKSKENATPLGQIKNMAGAGPLATAGPPQGEPQMPGRKPMVQPPPAPTAGGMDGLINKLGR
jgi:hypothetical protein